MNVKKKPNRFIKLEHVPILEKVGVGLIAILAIILYTQIVPVGIQSMIMMSLMLTCILQLIGFVVRHIQGKRYNKMYKRYLINVLLFFVFFISTTVLNFYFSDRSIILLLLAITTILLLSVLSFWSVKVAIGYLFNWRLKKIFPDERVKEPVTKASLKKLSKYIDIEKQRIYLIVQYGEKLILYGFSIYFTLWVVKTADFQGIPLLYRIQDYIRGWGAINFSVLLSLFSILLALLTICWPIQARIIEGAEKRLAEKFGESRL